MYNISKSIQNLLILRNTSEIQILVTKCLDKILCVFIYQIGMGTDHVPGTAPTPGKPGIALAPLLLPGLALFCPQDSSCSPIYLCPLPGWSSFPKMDFENRAGPETSTSVSLWVMAPTTKRTDRLVTMIQ